MPFIRRRLLALLVLTTSLVATLAAPAMTAAASAVAISSGNRSAPVVALTFDDATSVASLQSIFNTLSNEGAPATFFPTAQNMSAAPGLWQAIVAAGHPIGSHSFSHPQLTTLGDDAIRREINQSTSVITSVSGQAPINMLRPPYGAYNGRVAAIAGESGYGILALWDVDPRDWSGISAVEIVNRTVPVARNGSIILLHAGPNNTASALPQIIAGLRSRGFGFVTLPQLLGSSFMAPRPPATTAPAPPAAPVATPAPTPPPRTPMLMHMPTPQRPVSSVGLDHSVWVIKHERPAVDHRLLEWADGFSGRYRAQAASYPN